MKLIKWNCVTFSLYSYSLNVPPFQKKCTYLISTFTVYWTIRVIENVETRENGEIQLSEILQRINHKFTPNHIGGIYIQA